LSYFLFSNFADLFYHQDMSSSLSFNLSVEGFISAVFFWGGGFAGDCACLACILQLCLCKQHIIISIFFALGLELRAYALSHSTSPFFVKVSPPNPHPQIGSGELFAWAGFEP
jgi:hypothetical protein